MNPSKKQKPKLTREAAARITGLANRGRKNPASAENGKLGGRPKGSKNVTRKP